MGGNVLHVPAHGEVRGLMGGSVCVAKCNFLLAASLTRCFGGWWGLGWVVDF